VAVDQVETIQLLLMQAQAVQVAAVREVAQQ
jgi:hypothetical protein